MVWIRFFFSIPQGILLAQNFLYLPIMYVYWLYIVSEWVSDCCLTPIQQFFNYIMARTSYFPWDDDEVRFFLDQQAEFDFYSARSLKQQSAGRHVAPLGHIILIPSQSVFALRNINVLGLYFVRYLHYIMGTFTKTMHDQIQFDCLLSSIITTITMHDDIQC